jgi:hypothetical protein
MGGMCIREEKGGKWPSPHTYYDEMRAEKHNRKKKEWALQGIKRPVGWRAEQGVWQSKNCKAFCSGSSMPVTTRPRPTLVRVPPIHPHLVPGPWHISINIICNSLLGVHLGRGGVEGAPRGRWGVARGRIVDEEQRGRLRAVVWGGSAGGDSPAPPLGSREQRRPRLCSGVHLLLPAHPLLRALPSCSDNLLAPCTQRCSAGVVLLD